MRKPLTVTLVGVVLGLGVAEIALASDVPDDRQATFETRARQAIAQRSIAKLEALRSNLERRGSLNDNETSKEDHYNLAYLDWRISHVLPDNAKKEKRRLLKQAQRQLESILETDPSNAEVHALRGSAIGEQIGGMWSGMRLGRKARSGLDRALELEPDNPRVALQRGISFFFTPKTFGGGLPKAEQELRRARDLFAREPPGKPWPNWGQVDVLAWLGQTLAKAGKTDEARSLYEDALKLEPAYTWVRDVLLPGLDDPAKRGR